MAVKPVQFVKEVCIELKKCEWPVKRDRTLRFYERIQELVDSTIVVIVCLVLMAAFIGAVDFLLSQIVKFVLK